MIKVENIVETTSERIRLEMPSLLKPGLTYTLEILPTYPNREIMENIAEAFNRLDGAPAQDFDAWQQNPYTRVLMKSIAEDYVPRTTAPEADLRRLIAEMAAARHTKDRE
jgi:hypothetical protein